MNSADQEKTEAILTQHFSSFTQRNTGQATYVCIEILLDFLPSMKRLIDEVTAAISSRTENTDCVFQDSETGHFYLAANDAEIEIWPGDPILVFCIYDSYDCMDLWIAEDFITVLNEIDNAIEA